MAKATDLINAIETAAINANRDGSYDWSVWADYRGIWHVESRVAPLDTECYVIGPSGAVEMRRYKRIAGNTVTVGEKHSAFTAYLTTFGTKAVSDHKAAISAEEAQMGITAR